MRKIIVDINKKFENIIWLLGVLSGMFLMAGIVGMVLMTFKVGIVCLLVAGFFIYVSDKIGKYR